MEIFLVECIFHDLHLIDSHGQEYKVKIVHSPRCYSSVKVLRHIFIVHTKPSFSNTCTDQEKKRYLMDPSVFGRECSCIVATDWLSS